MHGFSACHSDHVIAIMAVIIRLSCRKVVLETLFCIGCKSAKMFIGGFLFCELLSWKTQLYYKNPLISAYFLAKVLIIV